MTYTVVVGNIGTVYEGEDEQEAKDCFIQYVEIIFSETTRADWPVVLLDEDEVLDFMDETLEEEATS